MGADVWSVAAACVMLAHDSPHEVYVSVCVAGAKHGNRGLVTLHS